jgi:hypothetical protein
MKTTSQDVFEVRCHRCEVSFPLGTKRCMYCGGKPSAGPPQVEFLDIGEMEAHTVPAARRAPGLPRPRQAEVEQEGEAEEEEQLSLRQTLPRVAMSLAWVVLLVVVSIYRACAG